jgi:hypothetical protein
MSAASRNCSSCVTLKIWTLHPGLQTSKPLSCVPQTRIAWRAPRIRASRLFLGTRKKWARSVEENIRPRLSVVLRNDRQVSRRTQRGVISASAPVGTLVEIVAAGTQTSNSSGHVIANLAAVANVALTAVAVAATAYLSPYADSIAGRYEGKLGGLYFISGLGCSSLSKVSCDLKCVRFCSLGVFAPDKDVHFSKESSFIS